MVFVRSARTADSSLARDTAEAAELLQALVRAPSPNPPGDEWAVQEVVRSYLATIPGIDVQEVGVDPRRPILVATLEGTAGPGPSIVLAGHVDTVPIGEGWTRDPFGGEVEAGRLYGRGASDMKAGVAGLLVAMRRLADIRDQWAGKVIAHVVPDEEPGGRLGAQILLDQGFMDVHAAIVAEPSELAVYRAQKGNVFARVRINGRSAHGSMPAHGDNAISRAARLVVDLEERLAPTLKSRRHSLVGEATLSVGTIHGGQWTNIVPDQCLITVDRRLVPGESPETAQRELEGFIGERGEVGYEHVGAAFDTPEDHWLVQSAVEVVTRVRTAVPEIGGLVGSSDARYYATGAGVPTIIIGPGSMSQAHVPDEWVDVHLLGTSVQVYAQLVLHVCDRLATTNGDPASVAATHGEPE